jgi:deazaflavin-dependent oxidoreductase (nitroreductase family)
MEHPPVHREESPTTGRYRYREAGAAHRFFRRSGSWRPMSWFYARALHRLDHWIYRLTGGRTLFSAWVSGLPVVLLTTRGARTGVERTSPVLGIPEDHTILVIASNYGQSHHPGWAYNLRANPATRVRVDGQDRDMFAVELEGAERDVAYERGTAVYPGWIAYRHRAAPRVIPVFRLQPVEAS